MLMSKKVRYDRRLVVLLPFRTDPDYLLNTGVIPIPEYATKTLVTNLTFTFSPASLADGRQKPLHTRHKTRIQFWYVKTKT